MYIWLTSIFYLLNDILVDFLRDLKSLRFQLIIAAYLFNIFLVNKGVGENVQLAGIGLLSLVYTFFFYSKHQENKKD